MKSLFLYMLFCTGLISFLATSLGGEAAYMQYVHYFLLFISSVYCFYLILYRKIVISNLSLFIAGYIILRMIAVMTFALYNGYTLLGYLFPLKNWILLLNFFIIGQSIELSEEAANKLIVKALFATILIAISFEVLGFMQDPDFGALFQLESRISFVRYRLDIDGFIIVYAYLVLSVKMIKNELSLVKYQIGMALILVACLIAQTRQILVAIFIVSFFLVMKRYEPYLTKRKLIYTLSVLVIAIALSAGLYFLIVYNPTDTYFSLWRRSLLLDYIQEKVEHYPLFGYPIPSNFFGGIIPQDIMNNFYGFDFDTTIFPSDLPFLFILAEEGIVGLLFVATLLFLSYRKAPEKASYVILVLLSLIGTFRMYYLIPVGSSFTYFMLGFMTGKNRQG